MTNIEAVQDKEYQKVLNDHEDWVNAVSWSVRGLASCGVDQMITIHNSRGDIDKIFESASPVFCVSWAPDLATLISGNADGTISVWDVEEETSTHTIDAHGDCVRGVAWDSRGTVFASVSQDCQLKVWKNFECAERFEFDSSLLSLAWAPKSRSRVMITGDKGLIALVNTENDYVSIPFEDIKGDVLCCAWTGDNSAVVGTSDGTLYFLDFKGKSITHQVTAHEDWVTAVAFNSKQRTVATCGFNEDPTIKVWHMDASLIGSLEGHHLGLNDVCWNVDFTQLASASTDSTVRIWDTNSVMPDDIRKSRIESGHEDSCRACCWSPEGLYVASGSDDKSVRVWGTNDGKRIASFREHGDWVNSIAWNPAGTKLVTGCGDGVVRVWNIEEGKLEREMKGHKDWVEAVAWCSDGFHIASGSFEKDAAVIIWNSVDGSIVHTCLGHDDRVQAVEFHPDGNVLLSGSCDHTLRAWDVTTGCPIKTIKVESIVNDVKFSHTGALVAAACNDGTISIFEYFTSERLHLYKCHDSWVYSVAWSPLDTHIISGSEDKTVRVIELEGDAMDGMSDITEGESVDLSEQKDPNTPTVPSTLSGFFLDSPVFCVSWHEEEGVICSCASGRLVQLSVSIKRGRKSIMTWQQSFRKTMIFKHNTSSTNTRSSSISNFLEHEPIHVSEISEEDIHKELNTSKSKNKKKIGNTNNNMKDKSPTANTQSSLCSLL
eukprot:m.36990 g.36990  ORF g.36990 m.36990 type:complete len:716 (+) comp10128_c0_seq2:103-2250(+)